MTSYRLIIVAALVLANLDFAAALGWLRFDFDAQKTHAPRNGLCGSHCVQFVLEYYGEAVDLRDIVHELQYPDQRAGASLGDMQRVLQRAGIFTMAVSAPAGRCFHWKHPLVVFVPGNGELGHFVIAMDEMSNVDRVRWDGIVDVWSSSSPRLYARPYVALITAPHAFSLADVQATLKYEFDGALLAFGAVLVCGAVIVSIHRRAGLVSGRKKRFEVVARQG